MKKKILTIGALALAIIMIPVILVCFTFGLPAQYDQSFYGGMKIKYERLKNTSGKKLVVIGGSSVAFGVRSDVLELETGMPVVNFGLYANLGTKYMLDVAEKHIGQGDVVLIAPEQNRQALSTYFNGEAVWYSADGYFSLLTRIDRKNVGDLAKSFLKFTSGKFGYWQSGQKPRPEGIYNVQAFDAYGDISYPRPYNVMPDGYDRATPIAFTLDTLETDFIEYLNDYRARLVKKGATVLYGFCPMHADAVAPDTTNQTMRDYYDYVSQKLTFPVVGNPSAHLLESDWFYDSNFHLNDDGAIYYTLLLAQEIKAELGDFSPIVTKTPTKPQKPEDDGTLGSISEDLTQAAKIFDLGGVDVSSENGQVVLRGSWTIRGLTEYGRTLETIEIPDALSGLPVTHIADECFADNATVKKIVFGQNIESVGNRAFAGCAHLDGVYLTSTDPDRYRPAPSVFDGCDGAKFYVPQAAENDYLLNYFWSFIRDRLESY